MIKIKTLLFFVFLTFRLFAWGYTPSEGNINLNFGPYIFKTNFETSPSGAKSPILSGLGLIATGDVNDKGSLEVAFFDQHKIYIRETNGMYLSEQKEVIHITMGYRWWLSRYFSTSLSFYSSYSLGDPTVLHNDFPLDAGTDTSARDITEYGFDLAFQTELWEEKQWSVIADTRYSLTVTNKPGEKSDHYGILLGVRYLVQEKNEEK